MQYTQQKEEQLSYYNQLLQQQIQNQAILPLAQQLSDPLVLQTQPLKKKNIILMQPNQNPNDSISQMDSQNNEQTTNDVQDGIEKKLLEQYNMVNKGDNLQYSQYMAFQNIQQLQQQQQQKQVILQQQQQIQLLVQMLQNNQYMFQPPFSNTQEIKQEDIENYAYLNNQQLNFSPQINSAYLIQPQSYLKNENNNDSEQNIIPENFKSSTINKVNLTQNQMKKNIQKPCHQKKNRLNLKQKAQTETKNIIKSIGNKLLSYLLTKFPDNEELKSIKSIICRENLVNLIKINQEIQIASFYFLTRGAIPFIAQSKRLILKKQTIKYIDSFIMAAIDPLNFTTFKPLQEENLLEKKQQFKNAQQQQLYNQYEQQKTQDTDDQQVYQQQQQQIVNVKLENEIILPKMENCLKMREEQSSETNNINPNCLKGDQLANLVVKMFEKPAYEQAQFQIQQQSKVEQELIQQ